jgi:protein-S-isoprenylcysteine O-methyltransferase Ste14
MREGTGVSLAIGGLISGFFTVLGAIVVVVTYLFVCVYAIVKWIGDADGHPDPATIIVGFVAIVSLLVLGLLLGVRLVGRSFVVRRRDDRAS